MLNTVRARIQDCTKATGAATFAGLAAEDRLDLVSRHRRRSQQAANQANLGGANEPG